MLRLSEIVLPRRRQQRMRVAGGIVVHRRHQLSGEVGQPHEAGEVGAAQLLALGHIEELLTVAVDQLGAAARCAIDSLLLASLDRLDLPHRLHLSRQREHGRVDRLVLEQLGDLGTDPVARIWLPSRSLFS